MADIVFAECHGQLWMVLGDEHIGTVLLGTLPDDHTIEVVTVRDRAAVMALWWQLNPAASASSQPWVVNPLLLQRIRGLAEPGRRTLAFAPWSAMLDEAAHASIVDMARGGTPLILRQFRSDAAVPGHADLQRLRLQLVRSALEAAGADLSLLRDEVVLAEGADSIERLDIVADAPAL